MKDKDTKLLSEQYDQIITEWQPYGAMSRAGDWIKSKIPFAKEWRAQAQGSREAGQQANNLKTNFLQFVGRFKRTDPNFQISRDILLRFLKQQGYPITDQKFISRLSPNFSLDDKTINDTIMQAVKERELNSLGPQDNPEPQQPQQPQQPQDNTNIPPVGGSRGFAKATKSKSRKRRQR